MNSITILARLPVMGMSRRHLHISTKLAASKTSLQDFDPNNYNIPVRVPTMDDMMEPYGSWKIAYERERKNANMHILKGVFCLTTTLCIFYYSGVMDGLFMPNLDNIMQDTEPISFDKEGRTSV